MSKINGIDVSECYFYGDNKCDVGYIADSYPKKCKNNSDCYFKQLKRLQEENKELKQKKYEIEEKFLNLNCKSYSYYKALEEIRKAITESVPKKQGDYNFSKSLNPDKYALLEYIQNKINEVLNDRD